MRPVLSWLRPALLPAVLLLFVLGGCASLEPRPAPLSREDVVRLAKSGEPAAEIIRKLDETRTVLFLSGSDIVKMHQEGVPQPVLDHLQKVQIDAIRRRDALDRSFGWPYASPWNCPWPYGFSPYPFYRHPFSVLPPWPGAGC